MCQSSRSATVVGAVKAPAIKAVGLSVKAVGLFVKSVDLLLNSRYVC